MSKNVTLSTTRRRARKEHACIWCGEPIAIGEFYLDHRVVNGEVGCVDTQRWHQECEQAASAQEPAGNWLSFVAFEQERPHCMKESDLDAAS